MPPILEESKPETTPTQMRWGLGVLMVMMVLALPIYLFCTFLQTPPNQFPIHKPFIIEAGTSISQIVEEAKSAHLIRSEFLLYALLVTEFRNKPPQASTYIFDTPINVRALASMFARGDHDSNLISITIPEGTTNKDIANIAAALLPNFDTDAFLNIAIGQEGYLFPETYFIPATYTEEDLYTLLNDTFSKKIQTLEPALGNHVLSLTEIIILASIIEREANSEESMRMVSGILQKRLTLGMPLQVDASMEYVLDKPLSELTADDLKQESAYNTYLNTGLPPTPIGNPGLTSVQAVLEPIESEYLFYITGTDGNFYYARTFAEHRENIERYLR